MTYEDCLNSLYELNLDNTSCSYYRDIICDMHYKDKISIKNGNTGYKSYVDVLRDAKRTAKLQEEEK